MSERLAPMTASEVFEREALTIRAKILEIAASLDRIDRAPGSAGTRLELPLAAIEMLLQPGDADRAGRIQRLYSRDYDPAWRSNFNHAGGGGD